MAKVLTKEEYEYYYDIFIPSCLEALEDEERRSK